MFEKFPFVQVRGREHSCHTGWESIAGELRRAVGAAQKQKTIVTIECYHGVDEEAVADALAGMLAPAILIRSKEAFRDEASIRAMVEDDLTDDPVFGRLTGLSMADYVDASRLEAARARVEECAAGVVIIVGIGASLVAAGDVLVYADMARWEIQMRFRKNLVANIGVDNAADPTALQYKWAFFVDWRVCDAAKKKAFPVCDYVLDTNSASSPKLAAGEAVREGIRQASRRPFSVVPFFDPGPWGGQWMKEVCDLDRSAVNYAWCFNCVPEENSLLLKFGEQVLELPSIDVVFFEPMALLGRHVYDVFGTEFPIRFDYLDTMEGGNLSLQVHPVTAYIREQFRMPYTQDESYYMMEAKPGTHVYLGLKDGVDPEAMMADLRAADSGGTPFPAEKHVQKWDIKKHDHVLIPGGTVHCSGKDSVVLEISATPYIFTFKLWDWGRNGLDGKPRPTHIDHGRAVIQFDRTTRWTKENLINRFETIAEGDGWKEEKTGLHELEFIETRRHTFMKKTAHDTEDTVHVLCLVDGLEAIVESPTDAFEPFVVRYGETFIVPASVGRYTIGPWGRSQGSMCMTMKAYVRSTI